MGNSKSSQKDMNMDDFTDEYRECLKADHKTKKEDKKEHVHNDMLIIDPEPGIKVNKAVMEKLEFYLKDIRDNVKDAKVK